MRYTVGMDNIPHDSQAPADILKEAEKTFVAASKVRVSERRGAPPGEKFRNARIKKAIHEINTTMMAVRSLVHRLQWNDELLPEEDQARLRELSRRLQYERRQLKKMSRYRMKPSDFAKYGTR